MSAITVVKIGGSTLGSHDTSLDDVAALRKDGGRFVVVHGGGATISEWLEKHGVESRFVRGLRVTDERALDVVVAVLAGLVNKRLVAELEARGTKALGISGVDGRIVQARRADAELGFVGEVDSVDAAALGALAEDAVVVLAPIAVETGGGQLLNVNADTCAGEVAAALQAERLVFLTDVAGVMDGGGAVLSELDAAAARGLLNEGTVAGGMVPKVQAALRAASAGVLTAVVDGRRQGALRAAVEGAGQGTRIR